MVYTKEQLREICFPLGGIGAGCIGLAGNGRFRFGVIQRGAGFLPSLADDGRFRFSVV